MTIHSPIVRLGDVVQPLDPDMAGWQRLKRSPIALVPLGSQPMTIQRQRLEKAILDAEATPLAIDWVGPSEIHVSYQPLAQSDQQRADQQPADREAASIQTERGSGIAQASHQAPSNDSGQPTAVSEVEAERIVHWITSALDRTHPSVTKDFRIEVPLDQPEFSVLAGITAVTEVVPLGPLKEGAFRVQLHARSVEGPMESELNLRLTPHPKVVVPRRHLARGHRIEPGDLEWLPLPEEQLRADFVLDLSEVIGLEVRGAAVPGRPLNRSDLGAPTLIRRGDLIEVRVTGGGVTVTTNAKAQEDGSASELIEVETLQPRKRLLARVIQPGLVEIVTRAPRAEP